MTFDNKFNSKFMFFASKFINNIKFTLQIFFKNTIQVPNKMDIKHVLLKMSVKKNTIAQQESLACTINLHKTNLEFFFKLSRRPSYWVIKIHIFLSNISQH